VKSALQISCQHVPFCEGAALSFQVGLPADDDPKHSAVTATGALSHNFNPRCAALTVSHFFAGLQKEADVTPSFPKPRVRHTSCTNVEELFSALG
jgi:hypothetical protein